MIKLRARKLFRSNSKTKSTSNKGGGCGGGAIEWEVRPGGMLVQKREGEGGKGKEVIQVRISTGFNLHDISIGATSTFGKWATYFTCLKVEDNLRQQIYCIFGELKVLISPVTGLEPREQRLLFRGKEREDGDHLHMAGVKDSDKVLMLEDPAIKESKLRALQNQVLGTPCYSIKV